MMRLSLVEVYGALSVAIGLVGCGPGAAEGDGPGSNSATGTGSVSAEGPSTGDSGSVSVGSGDASGSGSGSGSYCGDDPPADPMPSACASPQPIMQGAALDQPTGLIRCEDGNVHRAEKLTCTYDPDPAAVCGSPDDPLSECTSHAECDAEANGYCVVEGMDGGCTCRYACQTDEDCGAGSACYCQGAFSECVPATCTTDADCGEFLCVYNYAGGLACQTPFDECRTDADCPGEECPDCAPDAAACAWTCQPSEYGCTSAGRPLLVDGHAVRAAIVPRSDWRGQAAASTANASDRARLAAHWRDAALMEHASVAAFARFALQLMALGAPPELLADTSAAMVDEIEHARVMFALAAADGGVEVGPGPLPMSPAMMASMDLVEVARLVAVEACVGETLAAVELGEAALHAVSPARRELLRRIADDELRHAALGWRFLRWALSRADAHQRLAILAAVDAAIEHAASRRSTGSDGLADHGVLDGAQSTRCRRAALATVVRPLAAALAGDHAAARACA